MPALEIAPTRTDVDGDVRTTNSGDKALVGMRHARVEPWELALVTARSTRWEREALIRAGTAETLVVLEPRPQASQDLAGLGMGAHAAAAREFASMVRAVDSSIAVYARVADGVLDLWVVLPIRDDIAEDAVAEAACQLMRKHDHLRFDFMILDDASPSVRTIKDAGYYRVVPETVWVAGTCRPM